MEGKRKRKEKASRQEERMSAKENKRRESKMLVQALEDFPKLCVPVKTILTMSSAG